LREQVENDFKCRAFPGLEADDVMGVLATHPKTVRESQPIIISQDKDMQTIPTQVWRQGELMTISEEQADRYHMFQTLVGDTSDGYKGCPGVGKVKAEKFLDGCNGTAGMWEGVKYLYEKASLTEQDALTQARLARILRWSDWNNEKKEPILWTPTS
jgi:DNA polymerase-1